MPENDFFTLIPRTQSIDKNVEVVLSGMRKGDWNKRVADIQECQKELCELWKHSDDVGRKADMLYCKTYFINKHQFRAIEESDRWRALTLLLSDRDVIFSDYDPNARDYLRNKAYQYSTRRDTTAAKRIAIKNFKDSFSSKQNKGEERKEDLIVNCSILLDAIEEEKGSGKSVHQWLYQEKFLNHSIQPPQDDRYIRDEWEQKVGWRKNIPHYTEIDKLDLAHCGDEFLRLLGDKVSDTFVEVLDDFTWRFIVYALLPYMRELNYNDMAVQNTVPISQKGDINDKVFQQNAKNSTATQKLAEEAMFEDNDSGILLQDMVMKMNPALRNTDKLESRRKILKNLKRSLDNKPKPDLMYLNVHKVTDIIAANIADAIDSFYTEIDYCSRESKKGHIKTYVVRKTRNLTAGELALLPTSILDDIFVMKSGLFNSRSDTMRKTTEAEEDLQNTEKTDADRSFLAHAKEAESVQNAKSIQLLLRVAELIGLDKWNTAVQVRMYFKQQGMRISTPEELSLWEKMDDDYGNQIPEIHMVMEACEYIVTSLPSIFENLSYPVAISKIKRKDVSGYCKEHCDELLNYYQQNYSLWKTQMSNYTTIFCDPTLTCYERYEKMHKDSYEAKYKLEPSLRDALTEKPEQDIEELLDEVLLHLYMNHKAAKILMTELQNVMKTCICGQEKSKCDIAGVWDTPKMIKAIFCHEIDVE